MKTYKLGKDGKTPELVKDGDLNWKQDRTVKKDKITSHGVDVTVSTVFLGLDHNWGDGPPILFETMIFGGERDEYQERYSTWGEAEEGHQRAIELVNSITIKDL
jgi:hypothetical protein